MEGINARLQREGVSREASSLINNAIQDGSRAETPPPLFYHFFFRNFYKRTN